MKKDRSLLLYLALIVLISCKKDPEPERVTYFMDEEFLDYSYFKQGSWWVYKRDSTTKDSVYVFKAELNTISPDSVDYSWQRSLMQYKSTYYSDTTTSLGLNNAEYPNY